MITCIRCSKPVMGTSSYCFECSQKSFMPIETAQIKHDKFKILEIINLIRNNQNEIAINKLKELL